MGSLERGLQTPLSRIKNAAAEARGPRFEGYANAAAARGVLRVAAAARNSCMRVAIGCSQNEANGKGAEVSSADGWETLAARRWLERVLDTAGDEAAGGRGGGDKTGGTMLATAQRLARQQRGCLS